MKCPNCGFKNLPEAKFCESCGTALPQSLPSTGKPFTSVFPAVLNLIWAVLFSLIALGIISLVVYAVIKGTSEVGFIPSELVTLPSIALILLTVGFTLAYLLPLIIPTYLAYKGLWNLDASGFKYGLPTSFYAIFIALSAFVIDEGSWFAKLIFLAIPVASAVCLFLDDNLVKYSSHPISILMPAVISRVISFTFLQYLIVTGVMILFSLPVMTLVLPYYREILSLLGDGSDVAIATSIFVILAIIFYIIWTGIMLLYGKLSRDLIAGKSKSYILGIVLFLIPTLIFLGLFIAAEVENFWVYLPIFILAVQVVLLALNDTRNRLR